MGRVLAIDYGMKRTGLAVTDPLKIIATALDMVPTGQLVDYLKRYTSDQEIEAFVIGIPVNLSGSDTDCTQEAKKMAIHLRKVFPSIPVHEADERFTSKMAFDTMIQSGISKKARRDKGNIDKISATILLQTFLETHRR